MKIIPVNEPVLGGNEKKYLCECVDTGWISSEGPFVARFETAFASTVGRSKGIAVCNGSAALDIAVAALGLQRGDEVIMPAFTIISCASAIIRQGAIPVLIDSDPITWNMDVSRIESKITSRTKAIMAVHIYGLPVDMGAIQGIAEKHGLLIIEDSAEMIGQSCMGKPCGSFGDVSTFSFYPNKHITTGEGGMVVTDDGHIAARCKSFRNLCLSRGSRRFIHDEMGWNYRMTNVQAALGLAQLERLDEHVRRKRNIGTHYDRLLGGVAGLQLPLAETVYAKNIYWVYGIVLNDDVPLNAQQVIEKLAEQNIGSRPFFYPMHRQPIFRKMELFADEEHPVAERLAERGFYIPSGLALTTEQMERVADVLQGIVVSC